MKTWRPAFRRFRQFSSTRWARAFNLAQKAKERFRDIFFLKFNSVYFFIFNQNCWQVCSDLLCILSRCFIEISKWLKKKKMPWIKESAESNLVKLTLYQATDVFCLVEVRIQKYIVQNVESVLQVCFFAHFSGAGTAAASHRISSHKICYIFNLIIVYVSYPLIIFVRNKLFTTYIILHFYTWKNERGDNTIQWLIFICISKYLVFQLKHIFKFWRRNVF